MTKNLIFFLWGGGGGGEESEFFLTKNPNLKEKNFLYLGWEGEGRVSEFFDKESKFEKNGGGGGGGGGAGEEELVEGKIRVSSKDKKV